MTPLDDRQDPGQPGVASGAPSGPPGGFGLDLPTGVALPREPGSGAADPLALTSLLLGVGSLLSVACCSLLSPLAALGAIVTGIVVLTRFGERPRGGRGLAVAGITLGALTLLAMAAWLAWWLSQGV